MKKWSIIILIGLILMTNIVLAQTSPIGYEIINDSIHIWNTQDNYYFNKSSGIQFTNHYEDYWTKNVFCLGYYAEEKWVKMKCADELNNFNRNIDTDNETYINITIWKDFSYVSYDLRLGVNYYLSLNDKNLSVTVYTKNIGRNIPFDLGFAWEVKDWEIPPSIGGDSIRINGSDYSLNGTYNLTFKNMTRTDEIEGLEYISYLKGYDGSEYLRIDWDNNLDYAVKMFGDGSQESFYTAILINAGHFNPNKEKKTTFQWIDAPGDTLVYDNPSSSMDMRGVIGGSYWINTTNAIIVFADKEDDISYSKTTDAGATWSTTEIEVGNVEHMASYFDKETPGDSGDLVHVAWLDSDDDEAKYVNIDVNDGTVGTIRTVDSGLTVHTSPSVNRISITKTVSANILYCFTTQVNLECYKSDDNFATAGTDIADVYEAGNQEDFVLLFPADTGDDNDACAVFEDRDANLISLKMYDDSESSWTETAIGSMIDDAIPINMDASVRHSDKHVLLIAHTDADSAGDDLLTWDLTVDSIASPTVAAKTNIFTDQAESAQVGIVINQQNDYVYVAYLKGGTWLTAVDVVIHNSTDGMANWGSETNYSEASADDIRMVHGGRTVGDDGGRIQWNFYNDDVTDIFVNLNNDIEISADTGDSTAPTWTQAPSNITIGNSSGLLVQYNATDETALGIYFIESSVGNFTMNSTGWLSNATFPLAINNFTLNISVNDSINNILRSEIYIDVYDDSTPSEDTNFVDCSNNPTTTENADYNSTFFINGTGEWRIEHNITFASFDFLNEDCTIAVKENVGDIGIKE